MPSAWGPVAYLTDVEGSWRKLESFARDNPYVRLDPGGRLHLAPGATFVFGGDAVDRGPHGRRLMQALLDARARHPGRVVLLAGNRDLNKLRLPRELGGHPPRRAPPELADGPREGLLRWIFARTMNAADAFAHRAVELAALGEPSHDAAVVDSFLADLAPGGLQRAYLDACQLAYRHGDTLYVHGGVSEDSLSRVPGDAARVDGLDAWVDALNAWYRAQLDAFARGALGAGGEPAWLPLLAYQAPVPGTRANPGSVVYGRNTDDLNNPTLPGAGVVAALARDGVRRLVVGHTPSGDSPSVLCDGDFQLVLADNSYGRVEDASRVYVEPAGVRVDAQAQLDAGDVVPVRFRLDAGTRRARWACGCATRGTW